MRSLHQRQEAYCIYNDIVWQRGEGYKNYPILRVDALKQTSIKGWKKQRFSVFKMEHEHDIALLKKENFVE